MDDDLYTVERPRTREQRGRIRVTAAAKAWAKSEYGWNALQLADHLLNQHQIQQQSAEQPRFGVGAPDEEEILANALG